MRTRSPNRIVGTLVGAGYLLAGILGFTATTGVDFFDTEGGMLVGLFEVNPSQNVVHLLVGAALLLAALSSRTASRTVNSVAGAFSLVLGLASLFLVGSSVNFLAVNVADNVAHFASAALLLAVGLGAEQSAPASAKDPGRTTKLRP